ncbi:unnamed protein product [Pseudo-nitzschia multistriata]|uniref:Peptide deformylase n=1 Tax=Pseudo-nitzschia multistriata TaxID=183589 RepID=A0A448Z612_9STRA|nr:unnamed protein product [Pseudo-nitzschia multistriata]
MVSGMMMARRSESGIPSLCQALWVIYLFFHLRCYCDGLQPQLTSAVLDENKSSSPLTGFVVDGFDATACTTNRRGVLRALFGATFSATSTTLRPSFSWASASAPNSNAPPSPFVYSDSWTGTRLEIKTLSEATTDGAYLINRSSGGGSVTYQWPMGKWPDPALRIPATPVPPAMWLEGSAEERRLRLAAAILRDTARAEGAVGLAAQQCGVDARMVYLSSSGRVGSGDLVLINPRITARSPEPSMRVWTEECLVLPPSFRATVLRDDWIDVEYDRSYEYRAPAKSATKHDREPSVRSLSSATARFFGEQSRCLQHELDHDRGILITDHVGLDELENETMRTIEAEGHDRRQAIAYARE